MTDGPPVVLLHGWGSSAARTWRDTGVLQRLEEAGRRPLPVDLPGHGRPGGATDPDAYADFAETVGSSLPDEELDGIGFSLGGKLLLWLAAARPNRFRRLVIDGVGDNIFRPEQGQPLAAGLRAPAGTDLGPLTAFIAEAHASGGDTEALAAVILRPSAPPAPEMFNAVRADVLLARGGQDAIARPPPRSRGRCRASPAGCCPDSTTSACPPAHASRNSLSTFSRTPGSPSIRTRAGDSEARPGFVGGKRSLCSGGSRSGCCPTPHGAAADLSRLDPSLRTAMLSRAR